MNIQQEWKQSAQQLQHRMERMSLSEVNAYFQKHLKKKGTNILQNKGDPQGDGDQSRIKPEDAQFYRDMFAVGGDMNQLADLGMRPLSDFAKLCISGDVNAVKQKLESLAGKEQDKTAEPAPELIQLLETRETAMRLSPLMMLIAMGKNLSVSGSGAMPLGNAISSIQIKVAELLLQYGARPDARDICGKTVCHYGMGAMATQMTLEAAELCIEAHESSHLFGQKVELHSLKAASKNGLQGICKGYVSGRRVVYLMDSKTTVSIKPQNLKLIDQENGGPSEKCPTKLYDILDRLGAVCLHELIMTDRADVAKILLKRYNADIEVQDCDGCSPRNVSLSTGIMSSVAGMVNRAAGKATEKDLKRQCRTCSNCGKYEAEVKKLLECAKCRQAQYCSKECQVEHWKKGGHKKACKQLAAKDAVAIVLDKPAGDMFYSTISMMPKTRGVASETKKEGSGYSKPSNIAVDEKFDVKVQGSSAMAPLMIYDKTRECNFSVSPGTSGFAELLKAVNAEPTWQGRKTFVAASFDAEGNCTVYPGVTTIHKW